MYFFPRKQGAFSHSEIPRVEYNETRRRKTKAFHFTYHLGVYAITLQKFWHEVQQVFTEYPKYRLGPESQAECLPSGLLRLWEL